MGLDGSLDDLLYFVSRMGPFERRLRASDSKTLEQAGEHTEVRELMNKLKQGK
jgi:hypothetical protein